MDRVGSGNRALSEYGIGIEIIYEYKYVDCTDVKNIVLELLGSDFDEVMGYLLQGMLRIYFDEFY
jgi:hypothetical protein